MKNFTVVVLCCGVFIVGCSGCGDTSPDDNIYSEVNAETAIDANSDAGEAEETIGISATIAQVRLVLKQEEAIGSITFETAEDLQRQVEAINGLITQLQDELDDSADGEPEAAADLQVQFDDYNNQIAQLREELAYLDGDSQNADEIPGQRFAIRVIVNSGESRIGAYQFVLNYDADLIGVNTFIGDGGVEIGKNGFLATVNPNIPGELIVNGFNVFGSAPGEEVELVIIHLIDRQEDGNQVCSTLSLEVEVLTDEMGVSIETPENEELAVSINCQ